MTPIATLIIPQHNHPHLTIAALQSIQQHEPTPSEIIIIDDGSTTDSQSKFDSRNLPTTRFIQQPHQGITAAWNRAAVTANSPYLIFLNNDTLCHGPFIEQLLAPLKSNRAILTGPALRQETALPPTTLQKLPTSRFLQGWCFALSRNNYNNIGRFDESMKLYFSDTDFQARLLQKHPSDAPNLTAIPALPIKHLAHQTTKHHPQRRPQWQADRKTFIKKWSTPQPLSPFSRLARET